MNMGEIDWNTILLVTTGAVVMLVGAIVDRMINR